MIFFNKRGFFKAVKYLFPFFFLTILFFGVFNFNIQKDRLLEVQQNEGAEKLREDRLESFKKALIFYSSYYTMRENTKNAVNASSSFPNHWVSVHGDNVDFTTLPAFGPRTALSLSPDIIRREGSFNSHNIHDRPFVPSPDPETRNLLEQGEEIEKFKSDRSVKLREYLGGFVWNKLFNFLRTLNFADFDSIAALFPRTPDKLFEIFSSFLGGQWKQETDNPFPFTFQQIRETLESIFQFFGVLDLPIKEVLKTIHNFVLALTYNSKSALSSEEEIWRGENPEREDEVYPYEQRFNQDFEDSRLLRWLLFIRDVLGHDMDSIALQQHGAEESASSDLSAYSTEDVSYEELIAWERFRIREQNYQSKKILPEHENLVTNSMINNLFRDLGRRFFDTLIKTNPGDWVDAIKAWYAASEEHQVNSDEWREAQENFRVFLDNNIESLRPFLAALSDVVNAFIFYERNMNPDQPFEELERTTLGSAITVLLNLVQNFSFQENYIYHFFYGFSDVMLTRDPEQSDSSDPDSENDQSADLPPENNEPSGLLARSFGNMTFLLEVVIEAFQKEGFLDELLDSLDIFADEIREETFTPEFKTILSILAHAIDLDFNPFLDGFNLPGFEERLENLTERRDSLKAVIDSVEDPRMISFDTYREILVHGILLIKEIWNNFVVPLISEIDVGNVVERIDNLRQAFSGEGLFLSDTMRDTILKLLDFFEFSDYQSFLDWIFEESTETLIDSLAVFLKLAGYGTYSMTLEMWSLLLISCLNLTDYGMNTSPSESDNDINKASVLKREFDRTFNSPQDTTRTDDEKRADFSAKMRDSLANPKDSSFFGELFKIFEEVLFSPVDEDGRRSEDSTERIITILSDFLRNWMSQVLETFSVQLEQEIDDKLEKYTDPERWKIYDFQTSAELDFVPPLEPDGREAPLEPIEVSYVGIYEENNEVLFSYRYRWRVHPIDNQYLRAEFLGAEQVDPFDYMPRSESSELE